MLRSEDIFFALSHCFYFRLMEKENEKKEFI